MLPRVRSLLAVCAHPDDESFGLGAVLHAFAEQGTATNVLCFTHGEASTLGAPTSLQELRELRADEMAAAARVLRVAHVELLDHADGALSCVPLATLADEVARTATGCRAELLLVFDEGGVTGHVDHCRATEAALAAASGLPVLAWPVPEHVASALNAELGTAFVGRIPSEIDISMPVERDAQQEAIACHQSQASDNPVLRRRLDLLGGREVCRWLRRRGADDSADAVDQTVDEPVDKPDPALTMLVSGLIPGRAVDLGAGEGRNSLWLARQGWHVTAVDASSVGLERLQVDAADAGLEVTTVLGDIGAFLAEGRRFDLAVLSFVQPAAEDRPALFAAVAAALSSGGHLFVVGHHLDSLGLAGPPDPARLYTEATLLGHYVPVHAEICVLDALSGHADGGEIVSWLNGAPAAPSAAYVVHGEPAAASGLADRLAKDLGWNAAVPAYGERVRVD